MANHVRSIVVDDADRRELMRLLRASTTHAGLSRRARAVLLMAEGMSNVRCPPIAIVAENVQSTLRQGSRRLA
jgi:hypothetical protein